MFVQYFYNESYNVLFSVNIVLIRILKKFVAEISITIFDIFYGCFCTTKIRSVMLMIYITKILFLAAALYKILFKTN